MTQIINKNKFSIVKHSNNENIIKNQVKSQGTPKKRYIIAVADFETTFYLKNDPDKILQDKEHYQPEELAGKVYLWHLAFENGEEKQGNTIKEFFQYLTTLKKRKYFIYFHNLKWDGEFLFSYLVYYHREEFTFLKIPFGGFMKITWRNFIFLDSFKFLLSSVKKLTTDPQRLERKSTYDYSQIKPKDYQPTEADKNLCRDDTLTILEYMINFPQNRKFFPLVSIASYSFYYYKKEETNFKRLFPNVNFEYLRPFYVGGFVDNWNKYHLEKQKITQIDINSLYPFIMESVNLPYGKPIKTKTKKYSYGFYIVKIKEVKIKDGFLPFIQVKESVLFTNDEGEKTEYIKAIKTPYQIKDYKVYLVEPIFNLFCQYYEGNYTIDYSKSCFFRSKVLFKEEIEKWKEEKLQAEKEGNPHRRQIAKIAQNSLYGKFGERYQQTQYILQKTGEKERKNIVRYLSYDRNYYKLVIEKSLKNTFPYLPVACSITAESKAYLIKHIQQIPKQVLYNDTDSLIIQGNFPENWIDNSQYGKWKIEGVYTHFHSKASKAYMLYNEKTRKSKIKHKGITRQENLTWEQFITKEQLILKSKQASRITGGIFLNTIDKILAPSEMNPKKVGINKRKKEWLKH